MKRRIERKGESKWQSYRRAITDELPLSKWIFFISLALSIRCLEKTKYEPMRVWKSQVPVQIRVLNQNITTKNWRYEHPCQNFVKIHAKLFLTPCSGFFWTEAYLFRTAPLGWMWEKWLINVILGVSGMVFFKPMSFFRLKAYFMCKNYDAMPKPSLAFLQLIILNKMIWLKCLNHKVKVSKRFAIVEFASLNCCKLCDSSVH